MFEADATIVWVDDNGMPQAQDYYLSDYVQVCFTLHNISVPLILIACLLTFQYNTVEPPNKEHVGDNINSAVLSFIERLSSFRGSKCTNTIGHCNFGTSNSVLYREVYYTVSPFQRVHYRRFHCTPIQFLQ